jgi:hypothetical protein
VHLGCQYLTEPPTPPSFMDSSTSQNDEILFLHVCHLTVTTGCTHSKRIQLSNTTQWWVNRDLMWLSMFVQLKTCVQVVPCASLSQDTEKFHGLPQSLQQILGLYLNYAITSRIIPPSDIAQYSMPLNFGVMQSCTTLNSMCPTSFKMLRKA